MNFIIETITSTDYDDLKAIEQILSEKDIICSIYSKDLFNRYCYFCYFEQIELFNNKFIYLLDRNIFSEIISFATKDDSSQANETQKRAFALLAFIKRQKVGSLIDPDMAIYEYMDSNHYDEAVEEYLLFERIYNLSYEILVDVALGRRDSILVDIALGRRNSIPPNLKGEDWDNWKLFYGCILKIANIEVSGRISGSKPSEKMEVFLKWMYKDYIFVAPAITFGLIYFSEKRNKNMIKNLKSNDKGKLVKGIRNATWDLFIAQNWAKKCINKIKPNNTFLLCTEDKALKAVSNLLMAAGKSDSELTEIIKNNFLDYFGKDEGTKMNDLYKSLMLKDETRKANGLTSRTDLYPYIDVLETEFINTALTESSNTTLSR